MANWQGGHTRNYHSLGRHYVLLWKTGGLAGKDNAPVCASRAISFALLLGDLVVDLVCLLQNKQFFFKENSTSITLVEKHDSLQSSLLKLLTHW